MGERGAVKESTIIGLADDIRNALRDLQDRLDNRFDRSGKETGITDRPQCPNVLDEIIEVLSDCKRHLLDMTSFISSEVLPKIN